MYHSAHSGDRFVPDISSRQHPLVKTFKAAARGEDATRAVLDGWHLLHEASRAHLAITTIAIAGEPPAAQDAALINRLARETDVFTVTPAVLDALSPVRTPSGVVALALRKTSPLPQLLEPRPALVLVAHDIQDPGNAGAMIRSAEAGGATGVLFAGASADPWGAKALRAAMGSTFRLPVAHVRDVAEALDHLRSAGLTIVATVPRDGRELQHIDLRRPCALLVGAEGRGLDAELLQQADEELSIPMQSPVESLNVAVAAALLVYEARRQREA